MEETTDLQESFQILKNRLVLIITLAFTSMAISGGFTHFFLTPIYQASTQLVLVPRERMGTTLTLEIDANLQLINTFNEVIVSPLILDEVIEDLGLNLTASSLGSMMSAKNRSNSQVITLTVQNENPVLARNIANVTAEVFEVEVLDNFNMDNVRILARAQIPISRISPRLVRNLTVGFLIGIMFGMNLAFMLEFLDKAVKTEHEIEKLIGAPVLGVVSMDFQNEILDPFSNQESDTE